MVLYIEMCYTVHCKLNASLCNLTDNIMWVINIADSSFKFQKPNKQQNITIWPMFYIQDSLATVRCKYFIMLRNTLHFQVVCVCVIYWQRKYVYRFYDLGVILYSGCIFTIFFITTYQINCFQNIANNILHTDPEVSAASNSHCKEITVIYYKFFMIYRVALQSVVTLFQKLHCKFNIS